MAGTAEHVTHPRRREFFGLIHQFNPLAASAIQITSDVQVDGQADFMIFAQAAVYTSDQFKVRFERVPGRLSQATPMFGTHLGTGQFPRYLAAPLFLPRGTIYRANVDDRQLVPASNVIRILHIGQKVFDRQFEDGKTYTTTEPFDYIANFTADNDGIGTVPASGSLVFSNVISADGDFDIYKVSVVSDGPVTVDIETSGKALRWFNTPCHSALLGGTSFGAAIPTGAWPLRLPGPVYIPASGTILTTVANLTAAANRVQVTYHGLRMYPPRGVRMA